MIIPPRCSPLVIPYAFAVLKFDAETNKVSLGLKQLQPDPWTDVEAKYPVGSRVGGKITNLADYGAFVALDDGIEGLIHVSEMSWTKKVKTSLQSSFGR